jgi:hypothetical protein
MLVGSSLYLSILQNIESHILILIITAYMDASLSVSIWQYKEPLLHTHISNYIGASLYMPIVHHRETSSYMPELLLLYFTGVVK